MRNKIFASSTAMFLGLALLAGGCSSKEGEGETTVQKSLSYLEEQNKKLKEELQAAKDKVKKLLRKEGKSEAKNANGKKMEKKSKSNSGKAKAK